MIDSFFIYDYRKALTEDKPNPYKPFYGQVDLVIIDPPFAISFNGKKKNNYNRNSTNVVDGYLEWSVDNYLTNLHYAFNLAYLLLKPTGQFILFSGWQNSGLVSTVISDYTDFFSFQGKMYFAYNFAPATKLRPAHNIYELFWLTRDRKKWTYHNRCSTTHCTVGEKNLSLFRFNREYLKGSLKYPTRLPSQLYRSLLEHFTNEGDLIVDFLAGSGTLGLVATDLGRHFLLSDINPHAKEVFDYYYHH